MTFRIITQLDPKIEINENGCHIWNGYYRGRFPCVSVEIDGYKTQMSANRAVWTRDNGPIPEGHVIRHTCDDVRCINGEHLVNGTQADNIQDMVDRGRTHRPFGKLNGMYGKRHSEEAIQKITEKRRNRKPKIN